MRKKGDSFETEIYDDLTKICSIVQMTAGSGSKYRNNDIVIRDNNIRIECKFYSGNNIVLTHKWVKDLWIRSRQRCEVPVFIYKNDDYVYVIADRLLIEMIVGISSSDMDTNVVKTTKNLNIGYVEICDIEKDSIQIVDEYIAMPMYLLRYQPKDTSESYDMVVTGYDAFIRRLKDINGTE